MKTKLIFLTLLLSVTHSYSQILIDNGPLIDPNLSHLKYVPSGAKWNKTALTYYIDNTSAHLTATQRQNILQQAFQTWDAVSSLSFTQVSNASSADLKIKWATGSHGDTSDFDGVGGVLAHAYYPPPLGGSYAGQIHFDDAENWTADLSGISLLSVAIHEIGHALGLAHSTVSGSIMNANYSGQTTLGSDDIQGILALYPISISGPVIVPCSGTVTYSLPSSVPVTSPTWTVSPNLQIVSGQGTKTITVSKDPSSPYTSYLGTITVSNSGSQIASMDVNIGPVVLQSISAPTTVNVGVPFYCTPVQYHSTSTYEWTINPVPYTNMTDGGSGRVIVTITQPGTYTVICREITACSKSAYVSHNIQVNAAASYSIGTDGDNRFVVSLTAEAKNTASASTGQTVTYTLYDLYSGAQLEAGELPYTGGVLNFSKYPSGLYILQINRKNGTTESHRIVIK
jgi:hypothetical protein